MLIYKESGKLNFHNNFYLPPAVLPMNEQKPKTFNTAGICKPAEHYMLPVLPRLPDASKMIEDKLYFVIHAPRQSGKTTFLRVLTDKINSDGKYYAVLCSLASLRPITDDDIGMNRVVSQINVALRFSDIEIIQKMAYTFNSFPGMSDPDSKVRNMLNLICRDLDRELIIFFDEADCLADSPLITFLTQIRDGYLDRTDEPIRRFPRSLALVGMRNIRDYKTQIRPEEKSMGTASPFNIITESFSLANFTKDEIRTLYGQHTEATGQVFDSSAIDMAWNWSEGQPWLVNALARDVVGRQLKNDFSVAAITGTNLDRAAESLIQRRDTHIDSLLERLKEQKVIKVMDAVFAGTRGNVPINSDDRQYCIDLGLVVKNGDQSLRPSNKIYQEVFSRVITDELEFVIDINQDKKILTDGKVLFMSNLLKEFQKFWRHDSRSFPLRYKDFAAFKYDEATYSFMLLAYMQKVVNSGGKVHRQFAEDRKVIDISAIYNDREYLVEVKLNERYFSLDGSLKQLAGYMDTADEKEGWLVVFDRDLDKSWDEKIFWDTKQIGNLTIHVVGC
jgi:signal recognition particle receptor subunit beta